MLDVNDILKEWELKLRFSIFHIFDVNALRVLYSEDLSHYNEKRVGVSMGSARCISGGLYEPPDFLLKKYYVYNIFFTGLIYH